MISFDHAARDLSREALAEFFSKEIQSIAGPDVSAALCDEIARAVAAYCAERHGEATIPDEYLALLLSRALAAAGQSEAGGAVIAERILRSGLGASGRLAAELPCSGAVLAALSAGIVRVGRDANGALVWTLNCEKLGVPGPACIEMLFFASLRALVEELGVTWDTTSGHGTLRLRGAGVVPGVEPFVRAVLVRVQAERMWLAAPDVAVDV
jgi:hypothetical protein